MPGYTIEYDDGLCEHVYIPLHKGWTPEMYKEFVDKVEADMRAEHAKHKYYRVIVYKSFLHKLKAMLCRKKK